MTEKHDHEDQARPVQQAEVNDTEACDWGGFRLRKLSSGGWGITPTDPKNPAKVWSNGGVNYICVEGTGADDSTGSSDLAVAVGVYNGSNTPPSSFPGVGGSNPTIFQASVTNGTFYFDTLSTFPTGAAATIGLPGAANILAIWEQDSQGSWGASPDQVDFNGRYSTQTDCGTGLGRCHHHHHHHHHDHAGDPWVPCKEPMLVERPVYSSLADVLSQNGQTFICVRGGNACDPSAGQYIAVAARIYACGQPVPTAPPIGDPMLRIAGVNDDQCFHFDNVNTYVPGAKGKFGPPYPANELVLWPMYCDTTWGRPKTMKFYGKLSLAATDCGPPVQPKPCGTCGPEPTDASPEKEDSESAEDEA